MSKKYRIYGVVTGSKYLGEVEADSKEEAAEKAFEQLDVAFHLCHQCVDEAEDAEIHEIIVEQLDG